MADDFRDFVKFDGFAGQAWYHQMIRDKRILRRAREFTPERLFKSGEQGVWYDPSDTATLFQDSAGTTPVTASGQPVGLMLDKSKGLVLGPEIAHGVLLDTFMNGGATVVGLTSGARTTDWIAVTGGKSYRMTPNGTSTRSRWQWSNDGGTTVFYGNDNYGGAGDAKADGVLRAPATATHVRIYFKSPDDTATDLTSRELPGHHATQPTAGSRPIYRRGDSRGGVNLLLNTEALATQSRAVTAVGHTLSFTGTGSITLSGASTAGPLVGTGVNDRVSLTFTPTAGSLTLTVSGSVTKGQLNLGPTALPYQRNDSRLGGVATGASTDLHWLETDGVDDGMVTGNINFTGTDKVSVFAGVRKLSHAARAMLLELSAAGSAGSFAINAPVSTGSGFSFVSTGSTPAAIATLATAPSPISAVLSCVGDIAADTCSLFVDGQLAASSSADQGTGNYGNYPLYLFRRGGSSLPFNGWFYGLAITGRLTTDAETVATERFLAAKSAVVIP